MSSPAFMTRFVVHRLTQAAVLLSETIIRTCCYTQFNSRTLEKCLGRGVALGHPAVWAQVLYEDWPQVPSLQKWDRNHIFSGSHHQTPSFPLVHALSITDGHNDKEQPGTDLALLKAQPFTRRGSREQRGQDRSFAPYSSEKDHAHLETGVGSPGERVFSVVALLSALESVLTRMVRDFHLCQENQTLLGALVQITVQLCRGCTTSQKLPGSDRDLSFLSCKWKLSLHFCSLQNLARLNSSDDCKVLPFKQRPQNINTLHSEQKCLPYTQCSSLLPILPIPVSGKVSAYLWEGTGCSRIPPRSALEQVWVQITLPNSKGIPS